VVGYQSKFRLRWLATKLHLFTIVACAPAVTAELLQRITAESFSYANNMKGTFRGLQSGFAVVPAVVSEHVLPDARQLVERRPAHLGQHSHFPLWSTFPLMLPIATPARFGARWPTFLGFTSEFRSLCPSQRRSAKH
jgi:hypothetical protein